MPHTVPFAERNIETNGVRLHTVEAGEPDAPVVLLAAGADDPVLGFTRRDRAAEVVTGPYREVVIEDAGRWLQQERPDQVNKVVLDFLSSAKAGGELR
jgi:pimeloyl-ACP methyl ester carboxylesterase